MNLIHLHYFMVAVQCGSIAKAAEKLYMDRGNLSTIISTLEKKYEVPLLIRTNKGITLTEFGKQFYVFAEHVLQEHAQLEQSFSNQLLTNEKSELLIFFPNGLNTISFFDVFNSFNEIFPHISLNINETIANPDIFKMLPEDLLFIHFFITTEEYTPSHPDESEFAFSLIEKTKAFAYCTEKNIIAQYKTITTKALHNIPILLYSSSFLGSKTPFLDLPASQINTISNFSLFKQMLRTGKYISIGSDRKNAIDMQEFIRIPFADNTKFYFYVAVKHHLLNHPVVSAFLKFFFDHENLPFPKVFQAKK